MKIEIIGSNASGKTTLAKKLSAQLNIPWYEKDNIVYKRTAEQDIRRPDLERDELYKEIISHANWIVEGTPRKTLNESRKLADIIILLDTSILIRFQRVFSRWLKQRIGKEAYNSKPTLHNLHMHLFWLKEFNQMKPELVKELSQYSGFRVFKTADEAMLYLTEVYKDERKNHSD